MIYDVSAKLITEIEVETVLYPKAYFTSLVYNLISNAFKYRTQKRPLQITVRTKALLKQTQLDVADNGRGLDLDKHGSKIFSYGKTFHGNVDAKGLGLFMTRAQLRKYGHSINMKSTPNEGSLFEIKFLKPVKQSKNTKVQDNF